MSSQIASKPINGSQGEVAKPGVEPRGHQGKHTAQPTPHRAVISLSLLLFVPAMWLVLHGNLSVQTALVRFIGALLVSWAAAWLVFATVGSFTSPDTSADATGEGIVPGLPDPSAGATASTRPSSGDSDSAGPSEDPHSLPVT
jgi:hypothetical protein